MLGSLFLTLPTRTLTGQQVISSHGYGVSMALSWLRRQVLPWAGLTGPLI